MESESQEKVHGMLLADEDGVLRRLAVRLTRRRFTAWRGRGILCALRLRSVSCGRMKSRILETATNT